MSKSRVSFILRLFRLLDPKQIEEYSQRSAEESIPMKKVSGGEDFSESEKFLKEENKAKIIPFKRSFDFKPNQEETEKAEQKKKDSEDDKESSSDFLIVERLKSRLSRRRLLEGEAKKLYQAGANLEFCETTEEGEESEAVEAKGILVNRKHP